MDVLIVFGSGIMLFVALTVTARWLLPWFWVNEKEVRRMTGTEEMERLRTLGANGHSRYSKTYPATRTRPWQRRLP